jgi:hypothetical protein
VALSEEQPAENGSIVIPRLKESNIICNIDAELEFSEKQLALLKEAYTEELVKEVSIRGSLTDILKRIMNIIDPFYTKCDEESMIRVSADLPESGYGHVPWGDYADFCPVCLQNGWLQLGKEEFEVQVRQRRYRFYSQQDMALFKDNLEFYLNQEIRTPPPRIMVIGIHGSGVNTQLKNLNKEFNLPIFKMKENFLKLIKDQKLTRKQ